MEKNLIFPLSCELTVSNVFEEKINIVLYEGIMKRGGSVEMYTNQGFDIIEIPNGVVARKKL